MLFNFPFTRSAEIIGSCNGILCIIELENNNTISLWNPSIRHKLTLPPRRFEFCGAASGFGFGFDQKSDDYKVIWINSFGCPKSAFVYAVKTGAWCEIACPSSLFSGFSSPGCFVNGALHWLVDLYIPRTEVTKRFVMTLDISTYVFGTIALPEPNRAAQQLTTVKGSVAVIFGEPKKRWICWVRGKNHSDTTNASWYVVYKTKTTPPFKGIIGKVLEMTTNGKFLLATHYRYYQAYNFVTGVLSRLEGCCYIADCEHCVETLELLDRGTAYDENQPS